MNVTDTPTGSSPENENNSQESIRQLRTLFHDIRSPLTSILLWAQSLQIEADFDAGTEAEQEESNGEGPSAKRISEGAQAIERNALIQEKCIKDLETLIYKLVSR